MRFFIATALLLAPALAAADDAPVKTPDAVKMHADDCARARNAGKTCVLDMGGEDIESQAPTAGGSAIGILSFAKSKSLIHIRRDFITEILRSAENVD
jgi:hypothetical protein